MANDDETETEQEEEPTYGGRRPGLVHVHARLPGDLMKRIRELRHQKRQTLAGWLELTLQAAVDLADEYSPAVADKKHASRRRG